MRFANLLNEFFQTVFSMMEQILGSYLSCYWIMWQSEWATDLIFNSLKDLNSITDLLRRHTHMTGTNTPVRLKN
jgi:hypothetical protein